MQVEFKAVIMKHMLCASTNIYLSSYLAIHLSINLSVYIHMHTYVYIYMDIYIHIYSFICSFSHLYDCRNTALCMCIYIYIALCDITTLFEIKQRLEGTCLDVAQHVRKARVGGLPHLGSPKQALNMRIAECLVNLGCL